VAQGKMPKVMRKKDSDNNNNHSREAKILHAF